LKFNDSAVASARQKYWGKFVDIPDLRLGPPRLAFGTPRGSQDPRLRTTHLVSSRKISQLSIQGFMAISIQIPPIPTAKTCIALCNIF